MDTKAVAFSGRTDKEASAGVDSDTSVAAEAALGPSFIFRRWRGCREGAGQHESIAAGRDGDRVSGSAEATVWNNNCRQKVGPSVAGEWCRTLYRAAGQVRYS